MLPKGTEQSIIKLTLNNSAKLMGERISFSRRKISSIKIHQKLCNADSQRCKRTVRVNSEIEKEIHNGKNWHIDVKK